MIALTAAEVADIVGGRLADLDPTMTITGKVEFDSRKVGPGDLFLAIKGDRVDGHDYAERAMAAGAVGVLATRAVPAPAILVPDPLAAIAALAAYQARRLGARIVQVTGSSGKTSTKDLLAQVLSRAGRTVAPPESFNNELGFPYTVLLADADTSYLVLEASARGIGHIRQLTEIAPPVVAAVLNVGSAHLGGFGSREGIAQAKGELVEALPADGVAVLNADDPMVLAMAERTPARVVTFGQSPTAMVRAEQVRLDGQVRPSFELVTGQQRVPVRLGLRGQHQVSNALAAAAVALECGLDLATIADALSAATARSHWRMEVDDTPDGICVVNDAYNANPESMASALRTLALLATGRRSVAVLGEMAELGPGSGAEHHRIGELVAELGIEELIAVGEPARPLVEAATAVPGWSGNAGWVADNQAAIDRLRELGRPGDVVLVKGSRAVGLEVVAAALLDQPPVDERPAP